MFTLSRISLLILLLLSQISTAQQTENSTVSTPGKEAVTAAETDPLAETAAAEPAPPEPAPSRAPGEYRASEQISDDLSVSFPVDI